MSESIPENMDEVKLKMARLKIDVHEDISEDDIITKAVSDLFQDYLDEAEEGHYDTGSLDVDTISVVGVTGDKITEFKSKEKDFISDFKKDAMALCFRLEDEAIKIAKM
ncbi:hypothetical protein DY120_05080 [Apilactobacillus micheneri]|uniref:Uncharacterized protein n=1 Tax=Apilactobacillus micheneri TaxID=1899430 RepID=A0ABY2Z1S6_9LACO|nr:hypothetical protein [Apilactobacillus micheneri]TPR24656.1 hypothetical protein DY114_05080 [Apilactobacillus micheneri]TPR25967.1 hypothetical protein DY111_05080 [Apilactobacillus micheneri]TPR28157.1 hypothetical protein DY113_03025 [Apilactobacillus micheneri]TPR29648.1 hypothetical protein DY117_05080 [Apilactobacillus micheneri]TPR30434.1 hypothetical protein DY120_05080 [Apilactobacillus micheneri]